MFEGGERSPNQEPHSREFHDSNRLVRPLEPNAKQYGRTSASTRHAEELAGQAAADGDCDAETMRIQMDEVRVGSD